MRPALLMIGFLAFTGNAYCQTACPVGVAPGSPQCGQGAADDPVPAAPKPTGEWLKTWGALVNADNTTQAWASTGMTSKRDAEADAIDQCQSAGFKGCDVTFTYRNQCVALAAPSSGRSKSGIASAPELVLAENDAVRLCANKGGLGCSVIYKDCTKPIFRKY